MSDRVFVTGIGIISAIGNSSDEVLNSINLKKSGIKLSSYLDTVYKNEIPFGEVKFSNKELSEKLKINSGQIITRTALLGMLAAKEAINHAQIKNISEARTGLISATSVGGMDRSEIFYEEFIADNKKGRLRNIIGHDCGDSTEKIADMLGIKDFITTISTACSSSANAIMFGARLIKNNMLDRVIAGGVDSITKFTLNGFNTLMILDRQNCRPFDEKRNGLNLGEGAGFIVLESERIINKNKKEILCELKGYGNASDAYHQTASSPDGFGACIAMRKALEAANLKPEEIDYINAHGTGTPNNDLSEGKAIENVFESKIPYFSSTKAYTGHTLGASGGIEAVLSVLAIKNNLIFPNLNFENQMKDLKITPVKELIKNIEVKNVLSNSFGFGGNNTTLIFSKI
ncbi:MAG: beta-ketoacyl-[acyl-carrier-protein] synthase family protein [Bacteroidales bacterium]|nr:beta-ketoacyl-[acyl-carrier-protein] synthase family protein [Bacteroidales bacterium]